MGRGNIKKVREKMAWVSEKIKTSFRTPQMRTAIMMIVPQKINSGIMMMD